MGATDVPTDVSDAAKENIHAELDDITMHLLTLSQDLIKAKLTLEEQTKSGFLGLAQSRKSMGGPSSVSHLQIPSEESDDFKAKFKTTREEQKSDLGDLNFNYFSLEDESIQDVVEDLDSKLGIQKRKKNDDEEKNYDVKDANTKTLAKDPIKWFGVLVPSMLRQTQKIFVKSVELSVDCANIQSQIESNIARKNYLIEQLKN